MFTRSVFALLFFGWLTPGKSREAATVTREAAAISHEAPAAARESPVMYRETRAVSQSGPKISREILYYVNEFRRSKGLPALLGSSYISSIALGHSRDMLTGKSPFGHNGFNQRIDLIRGKLGRLHVAAENVASGPMDAREVVDGWLHSAGHRRNIMGDFKLTGIGVAQASNGMIYFTQIFVK